MTRERFLRAVLWAAAVANLTGAVLFAFPASPLGRVAELPSDGPTLYRAMTALFILLFGGSYAWLAAQPTIHRPWVAFGAIGKTCAFLLALVLWLAGESAARTVLVMSGDLVLAALLAYGLGVGRSTGDGAR